MTRRDFARTAASALAPRLSAAPRLRIGIGTYSYHSLPLAAMVEQLNALRITEIEMSRLKKSMGPACMLNSVPKIHGNHTPSSCR